MRKTQTALKVVSSTDIWCMAKDDTITLMVFDTFSVSQRDARAGRIPQTGATIQIVASNGAKFKAGKALKDAVN